MVVSQLKDPRLARQLLFPTPPELIFWEVVEEHLSEAAFQIAHWQVGLRSHFCDLKRLGEMEQRLGVHLDGLGLAGRTVIESLLFSELEKMTEPTKATLAALTLLRTGERDFWYEILDALVFAESAEHAQALKAAFALYDAPMFEELLRYSFKQARSPREKAQVLELLTLRRIDPGRLLDDCFDTSYPTLKRAAALAAGRFGRRDLAVQVERCLNTDDHLLREAAIEAGLHLALPSAWSSCRALAQEVGESSTKALLWIALVGSFEDHRIIHEQLEDFSMRPAALWAAGFSGNILSAEHCVRYLDSSDEQVAKLASEAFGAITGLDVLFDDSLHLTSSDDDEDMEEGDEDEEEDTVRVVHSIPGLSPDTTDLLPRPEPYDIAGWWEANRENFSRQQRYISGAPSCAETLVSALRDGNLRRRHGLALELSMRTGGTRYVLTDFFSVMQRGQLSSISELRDEDLVNGFDPNHEAG